MNVIVPLNKRILVEPESKEQISCGGIIIPETANQKSPTKGRVLAIAEDSDINLKIQAGDIVLFSKYAGTEVTLRANIPEQKDRLVLLIKDEDILAVIEERKG
jgi:chaperonin GroES